MVQKEGRRRKSLGLAWDPPFPTARSVTTWEEMGTPEERKKERIVSPALKLNVPLLELKKTLFHFSPPFLEH